MAKQQSLKRVRRAPKTLLRLPDLDQAKSAVLNSLSSVDAQRGYCDKENQGWSEGPAADARLQDDSLCWPGLNRMLTAIKHVLNYREYLVAHLLTPPLHGFNLLSQMSGGNGVGQIPVQEVTGARTRTRPGATLPCPSPSLAASTSEIPGRRQSAYASASQSRPSHAGKHSEASAQVPDARCRARGPFMRLRYQPAPVWTTVMSARSDGKGLAGQLIPAPPGRDARSRNAPWFLAFGTGLIFFSQSVPRVAQAIRERIQR